MNNTEHVIAMHAALEEARQAYTEDEIPIGAVLVKNGIILARAHNINRQTSDPTAHAEILVIREATSLLNNERLPDCDLYVTKEPCAMCAGAIVHARIRAVYIGAPDIRFGACGTALNVCGNNTLNHIPDIQFGICEEESRKLLQHFFKAKRAR